MSQRCRSCGSSDIVTDTARGSQICTGCGMVLEDNIIVSEVQFSEGGGGGSNVVGQSVGADGTRPFSSMGPGFQSGYSRDSRMMTIDNGRKSIATLAASLSLYSHHIDSAHRYFKLAVEHRFIQGRKTEYVVAACLYIVCRYEKTSHMLLDFADALQVNVFTLGSVYLKLVQKLSVRGMPIIDPSLYMLRFANKMKFGDKTHEVGRTALRLVARMKRDWIQVGRRPTGICGAALLVAARLHGFSKTQKEVIQVVRVCDSTLRKRLEEFEETPSSNLTTQEFMKIDLEGEADPPAYTQARKKARLKEKQQSKIASTEPVLAIEDAGAAIATAAMSAAASSSGSGSAAASAAGAGVALDLSADLQMQRVVASAGFQALDASSTGKKKVAQGAVGRNGDVMPVPETWVEPEGEIGFSDLSDDELDGFILRDEEVEVKESVWVEENAEYLIKQEAKQAQATLDKEMGIVKPDPKKRKRKSRPNKTPANAGEAVQQMIAQKKVSSKINYDVLKMMMMDEDGTEGVDPAKIGVDPAAEAAAAAAALSPAAPAGTNTSAAAAAAARS